MNLTQAQIALCHRQLTSDKCPVCRGKKDAFHSLCKSCYFALPEDMRPGLWIKRTDVPSIMEFAERYVAAKDWLRSRGISRAAA